MTQGQVGGWDAIKPLYWRFLFSKVAGWPPLTHHHRDRWNGMKRNKWDECGEMVEWNLWRGKTEEIPKKLPKLVSSTTKPTCSDRGTNLEPQRWGKLASKSLRCGIALQYSIRCKLRSSSTLLWMFSRTNCYFRARLRAKEVLQSSRIPLRFFLLISILHHSQILKRCFRKMCVCVCVSVCLSVWPSPNVEPKSIDGSLSNSIYRVLMYMSQAVFKWWRNKQTDKQIPKQKTTRIVIVL